ncbi:MAG: PQQ-binding-like beta-propeller repeat protein, partial [Pirellula staleyi]
MTAGSADPSTMGRVTVPTDPLQWKVICLDFEKGSILWEQTVAEAIPKYGKHVSNTYATETPAASNDAVYVWFGSVGVMAAYDHTGKPLWKTELKVQKLSNFGTGSSPVLHEGKLFLQLYNDDAAQLVCMDALDGNTLWQAKRSAGSSWSTPVLWRNNGAMEIVAAGSGMVIGYDLETGSEKWRVGNLFASFSASLVGDQNGLYFGTSNPGRQVLMAVAPGQKGDLTLAKGVETSPGILWSSTASGVGMPSPIVVGERLYFFSNTANCYDKRDGKEVFRARLPGGTLAAGCPVAVGETIYLVNEAGKLLVINATSEFKVESELQIGSAEEIFWSSPALANQSL